MKRENVIVSLIISISLFGIQVCYAGQSSPPIFENAVTLEFSFVVDDLPEDYLIGYPARVAVADNGDMILSNDGRLLVYNPDGSLKLVSGTDYAFGRGNLILAPDIVETGNITVQNWFTDWETYNLYDSDYNFIEKVTLVEIDVRNQILDELDWKRGFNSISIYG